MPIYRARLLNNYIKTSRAVLAADGSTTSATFATLLTTSVTTTGGNLDVQFFASILNLSPGAVNQFQLQVDGVTLNQGSSMQADGGTLAATASAGPMVLDCLATGLAAGSHTVAVLWATSAGTLRCRPVASAANEYAVLKIREALT